MADLKIELPISENRVVGVYKITFDDGAFYIGCSRDMASRSRAWKLVFGNPGPNAKASSRMLEKIRASKSAVMEVVELCDDQVLTGREAHYLKKYAQSPMLMSFPEYAWSPILQYSIKGKFIDKYDSIGLAARYNSFPLTKVQEILKGFRKSYKGMIFLYEEGGAGAALLRIYPKMNGGKIEQIDAAGNVVGEFLTYTGAAKSIGCSRKNIERVILGIQKTAGGYAWKLK